jgi:hypothetical protein
VTPQSSTQGVALGWVKLGFQPERNTGYSYNLQADHIFAILFGQFPRSPQRLSFRTKRSGVRNLPAFVTQRYYRIDEPGIYLSVSLPKATTPKRHCSFVLLVIPDSQKWLLAK